VKQHARANALACQLFEVALRCSRASSAPVQEPDGEKLKASPERKNRAERRSAKPGAVLAQKKGRCSQKGETLFRPLAAPQKEPLG
jgi:hypothetical protein